MKSRNTKNKPDYVSEYNLRDHIREMRRDETPPGFNLETQLTEMHWPSGADIPNACFLRKRTIVPKGELMPKAILVSPGQLSMNEKDAEILQGYWKMSAEDFEDLLEEGKLGKDGNAAQHLFEVYTSSSSRAATPLRNWLPPSIFCDGDLDYQWGSCANIQAADNQSAEQGSVVTASITKMAHYVDDPPSYSTNGNSFYGQPSRPEQALNAAPVPIQQNWSRLSFESACRENTSPKGVSRFKKASEAGNLSSLKTVPSIDENEHEEACIAASIPKFAEIANRSPAGKLASGFGQKSVILPTEKKKPAGDVRKAGKATQTPTHTTREAMVN
jgi:hypothetical protein